MLKKAILIILFACLIISPQNTYAQSSGELGRLEYILIQGSNGEKRVIVAKIDTGADNTSIDSALVAELGLKSVDEKQVIVGMNGKSIRDTVEFQYELGGKTINTVANVADRSSQSTMVLIGYPDLKGFVVDPNAEFIASQSNLTQYTDLIIIPILSSIIVALRYFVGIKTFGVFAPIIIGYALKDNVYIGLGFIILLTLFGFCLIHFGIRHIKMPKIVEQSILMFVLASLSLMVIPFWGIDSFIFFPFVIMAYLIERASQMYEENSYKSLSLYIVWTIIMATFLSFVWQKLASLDLLYLLVVFVVALVLTIASGKYTGLRLSELIRFKKIVFS